MSSQHPFPTRGPTRNPLLLSSDSFFPGQQQPVVIFISSPKTLHKQFCGDMESNPTPPPFCPQMGGVNDGNFKHDMEVAGKLSEKGASQKINTKW